MTKTAKRTGKEAAGKPGRKTKKVRSHLSLAPNMHAAAEVLGANTFGNKTAFLEHLIMKELERLGLTTGDIILVKQEQDAKGDTAANALLVKLLNEASERKK